MRRRGGALAGPALALLLVVAGGALVVRAAARPSGVRSPLRVAVTVPPQAWLVRRLAGDAAEVEVMLPPGASEHTYEPTPQQVARLASAQLLVEVGHPALLFERRLLDGIGAERRAGVAVVDMSRHAPARRGSPQAVAAAQPLAAPTRDGGDPHLWLSPVAMRATAIDVATALARLDPAGAARYRQRLAGVLADVDAATRDAHAELCGARGRRVYVDHPAWAYLLAECGIEQVAIEPEGKEPSPRELVALVESARRDRTHLLFVQRGVSARPAAAIAREIGARVVTIDPLAEDWPANLRTVSRLFHEALGG